MDKIESKLNKLIKRDPFALYKIIILLDTRIDPNKFRIDKSVRIMENILSASLTGAEILELSKIDVIISIELDIEMNTL